MTTAMMTDLELMRARLSGAIGHQLPGHIERLGWDAGRLPDGVQLLTGFRQALAVITELP